MPFEYLSFCLGPVLDVVAMLIAALAIELIGQLLDFRSQLFRGRMLRLGWLSPAFVVMFLRHGILLCVNRDSGILRTSWQRSFT